MDLHVLAVVSVPRGETRLGNQAALHTLQQKWTLMRKGLGMCMQQGPHQGVMRDFITMHSVDLQPSQWSSA